jgi:hypothetical protein
VVTGLVFGGDWKAGAKLGRRLLREARRLQNAWAVAHMCLGLGWALYDGGRLQEAQQVADDGLEAARETSFLPLQVLNAALGGRCRRDLYQFDAALELHSQAWQWSQRVNTLALQAIAEELCADHAAIGRWDEAARWAEESRRWWGEAKMFAHLSGWTVAEALLRKGALYSPPELPDGDRYRLVALRTEAVVARLAGRPAPAESALGEARELASRLDLPLQAAELNVPSPLRGG